MYEQDIYHSLRVLADHARPVIHASVPNGHGHVMTIHPENTLRALDRAHQAATSSKNPNAYEINAIDAMRNLLKPKEGGELLVSFERGQHEVSLRLTNVDGWPGSYERPDILPSGEVRININATNGGSSQVALIAEGDEEYGPVSSVQFYQMLQQISPDSRQVLIGALVSGIGQDVNRSVTTAYSALFPHDQEYTGHTDVDWWSRSQLLEDY